MHIPTSSTLSRGGLKTELSPSVIPSLNATSVSPIWLLLDYMQPHVMFCYMEAYTCGVRGVMRVAHIDMRNTSVNCPAPLTQSNWISERELVCGSTNTTVLSSDSVITPTNMGVGGLLGLFSMGCVHAYTWPFSVYMTKCNNTILGTSWSQRTKLCTAVVAGVHLHQPTHSLWERLNTIMWSSYTTTVVLLYIVHIWMYNHWLSAHICMYIIYRMHDIALWSFWSVLWW